MGRNDLSFILLSSFPFRLCLVTSYHVYLLLSKSGGLLNSAPSSEGSSVRSVLKQIPSDWPRTPLLCCTPRIPHALTCSAWFVACTYSWTSLHPPHLSEYPFSEMATGRRVCVSGLDVCLVRSSHILSLELKMRSILWHTTEQGKFTGRETGNQGFWRYLSPASTRHRMSRLRRGRGASRSHHWACSDSESASDSVFRLPPSGRRERKHYH